jgi:NAD(P)-dependent dehydrogenase (short-subunit alcohol dehydrogenase family)
MNYIFITGISSGIGYHAAKTLAGKGFHIIGSVRNSKDAERIRQELGERVTVLIFDVTDIETTKKEIESVFPLLEKDGLSVLINNAGAAVPGPMQYLPEEDFLRQMDINVFAVRRITNLLLPYLGVSPSYKPGKIINISSVSGLFNAPYNGAYCISKHALESMTDIYRRELRMFGIQVSAIEPGPVKSNIWNKNKGALDRFLDTEYGSILSKADKIIENSEKSALDTSVISQVIEDIIRSDNPKTRYLIHRKKWLFKILSRYIPDKWADALIHKSMTKKDKFRPV